jgi:glutamate/tyrosine decarboxylase-like PLP-dependent enzyme
MIEGNCDAARQFADGLRAAGFEVLNEVVLNQVVVSFGSDDVNRRVVQGVLEDGTCWCGGTLWQGRSAMRISVSSWRTTPRDVERSLEAIIRVARSVVTRA